MAVVTIDTDSGVIDGDHSFVRVGDPVRTATGDLDHTLRAGWEVSEGQLSVSADRLGILPLFHAQDGPRWIVASSLKEVCARLPAPQLDLDAMSLFLRVGYYIGTDTAIEGVRVLPPEATLEVDPNQGAKLDTPELRSVEEYRGTRESAIEQYAQRFREAVRRRSVAPTILPLSGGRDSRHILFELVKQGAQLHSAVTADVKDSKTAKDSIIAAQLCDLVGVSHLTVPIDSTREYEREATKNDITHFLSDEHGWLVDLARSIRGLGASLLMDGLAGDSLSNSAYFDEDLHTDMVNGNFKSAATRMLGEEDELGYVAASLRADLSWERARDRMAADLPRHHGMPAPVASHFFFNKACRETSLAPIEVLAEFDVALPYLDPDVMQFLLSLPGHEYGRNPIHDEVIRAIAPEWASVPYEKPKSSATVRSQRSWSAQATLAALRSARCRLVDSGFVAKRIARMLLTGNLAREEWWNKRVFYLAGLEAALKLRH